MLKTNRAKREEEEVVGPHLPLVVEPVCGQRERRQGDELEEDTCVRQELKHTTANVERPIRPKVGAV